MSDGEEALLNARDAAIFLGITTELIFQFTKHHFAKTTGLRSLKTVELDGKTWFKKSELNEFDKLLSNPWCEPHEPRPNIPKAILDHLKAESQNQCSRCGTGSGVDTAHIVAWSKSRSHHPNNLLRICSQCHREHDAHQSLSSADLKQIKSTLIEKTRNRLRSQAHIYSQTFRPPRCAQNFFGREEELRFVIESLKNGESILVSGVGGIGKTELLLQALNQYKTERVVFWINLEQYQNITELTAALRNALSEDGIPCDENELPYKLDQHQACVIFDGIEQSSNKDIDGIEDVISQLFRDTYSTQFVLTTQVKLFGFPADRRLELQSLKITPSRSLLLKSSSISLEDDDQGLDELLIFCDGHPLAIQFAGALTDYYGGPSKALTEIKRNGRKSFGYPGRQRYDRKSSLDLCLNSAYITLSSDCRKILWALALSPAGLFTEYLEENWSHSDCSVESLATLRRWHFLTVTQVNENLSRTNLLGPIRQFAMARGLNEENEIFESIVRSMILEFGMMVAVLELHYDSPEQTSHVIRRYEMELPNLMGTLKLAQGRESDQEIVKTTISIARSLMRYFFVSRLPELGAKLMLDAADMALRSSYVNDASTLAMQYMSLATRSIDDTLVHKGIELVERIEHSLESLNEIPDLAMTRAIASQKVGDFILSEKYARQAYDGYQSRLSSAIEASTSQEVSEGLHNDIANALGILGYSLLSQKKYQQAKEIYSHSLRHEKGSSIGVNRGQTLHQLGNCEAYLGNNKSAANYYFEAAKVFHFVNMEEYLSNAVGELGYILLDTYLNRYPEEIDEILIDSTLLDMESDVLRALDLTAPLNHQYCVQVIRKLFGVIILVSFTNYGEKLNLFSTSLSKRTTSTLINQIKDGERHRDEIFPVTTIDMIFYIGFLIAQAEIEAQENGDISNETTGELLRVICEANDWSHEVMRLTDWASAYFTKRWKFKGITPNRLMEFVTNYKDDIVDYIDFER